MQFLSSGTTQHFFISRNSKWFSRQFVFFSSLIANMATILNNFQQKFALVRSWLIDWLVHLYPPITRKRRCAMLRTSPHPLRSWPFSKLSCWRFDFFPRKFAACSKPPSRDNYRKASYPRTQQRDQGAGWTHDPAIRVVVKVFNILPLNFWTKKISITLKECFKILFKLERKMWRFFTRTAFRSRSKQVSDKEWCNGFRKALHTRAKMTSYV